MDTNAKEGRVSPPWRVLYEAAVLELDRKKLPSRIAEAERAIMDRMEDVNRSDGAESVALMKALDLLRNLRRTEIGDDGRTE